MCKMHEVHGVWPMDMVSYPPIGWGKHVSMHALKLRIQGPCERGPKATLNSKKVKHGTLPSLKQAKTRRSPSLSYFLNGQPSHALSCFLPHVAKLRWTRCHLILPIQGIVRIQNHPSSSHIPIGPWKAYTLWQGIPPLLPPLTPLLTKAYTSLEFCMHGWGSLISFSTSL